MSISVIKKHPYAPPSTLTLSQRYDRSRSVFATSSADELTGYL